MRNKNRKISGWLEDSLDWFQDQLSKWYGPIVCVLGLPLLFIYTLVSWPIRYVISMLKGNND